MSRKKSGIAYAVGLIVSIVIVELAALAVVVWVIVVMLRWLNVIC